MDPDHECYWTRRRRTLLTRRGRSLSGIGIPIVVLRHAASRLAVPMMLRPLPGEEYTDEVRIGAQVGDIHDGCFIGFEQPSPEFERALLDGVGELHATYLGGVSVPAEALVAVRDRLRDGWSVEMDANPGAATLRIRAFPADAGWWARFRAPALMVRTQSG